MLPAYICVYELRYLGHGIGIPIPRPAYQTNNTVLGKDAYMQQFLRQQHSHQHLIFSRAISAKPIVLTDRTQMQEFYDFAETENPGHFTPDLPAAADYYNTNIHQSQLMYGSLWLIKATGNRITCKRQTPVAICLRAVCLMALLVGVTRTVLLLFWVHPWTRKIIYKGLSMDYLNRVMGTNSSNSSNSICNYTWVGVFFCENYSTSNSVVPPLNTGLMIAFHKKSFPSLGSNDTDFIKGQLNHILRDNYN